MLLPVEPPEAEQQDQKHYYNNNHHHDEVRSEVHRFGNKWQLRRARMHVAKTAKVFHI
jgi:hypothetical protein